MIAPKKILFVITHLELGGAHKQLLSLIEKLDRDKYSLYLISGDRGYLKEDFAGLSCLNIKFIPELVRAIRPLNDVVAFFKLYFYIKRGRFDIVHTHSPKASILGRWAAYLAGVKNIIYTVHGWPFHKFMNPVSYHIFLWLERLTAKFTKKIIVVSKEDLKTGISRRIARSDKFILIHYGIDTELTGRIFLERRKNPPDKKLIVNISSLKRQKGLSFFLKSAGSISDRNRSLKFLLIGDGPLRDLVLKDISDSGLKDCVLLKGWTKDIFTELSRASLLVLTSLWEGLALVVIEAIAAGIPVVATDTGGILDVMEDGKYGIVVKPGKKEETSKAVLSILDNYDEWLNRIEESRRHFDFSYWSRERMIKQTADLYESLRA